MKQITKPLTMEELKSYDVINVEGWERGDENGIITEFNITYEIKENQVNEKSESANEGDIDWYREKRILSLKTTLEYINDLIKFSHSKNNRCFITGKKKSTSLKGYQITIPKLNFRKML